MQILVLPRHFNFASPHREEKLHLFLLARKAVPIVCHFLLHMVLPPQKSIWQVIHRDSLDRSWLISATHVIFCAVGIHTSHISQSVWECGMFGKFGFQWCGRGSPLQGILPTSYQHACWRCYQCNITVPISMMYKRYCKYIIPSEHREDPPPLSTPAQLETFHACLDCCMQGLMSTPGME